jgi:hypothetical protein
MEEFESFFKFVKKEAYFRVEICHFASLPQVLTNKLLIESPLSERSSSDYLIAINNEYWEESKKDLFDYLKNYFKKIFEIILYIYKDKQIKFNDDIKLGKKNCFVLTNLEEKRTTANNFILYVTKIYNELIVK